MKRIALVFFLAILLPSLLLAVLAIRSVKDQSVVLNSQRALFYEAGCESAASEINLFMDEVRLFHGQLIEAMIGRRKSDLVETFDESVTTAWSQASVGAVVNQAGNIITPRPGDSEEADGFLTNHSDFLRNERTVEVYQAPPVLSRELVVLEEEVSKKKPGGSSLKKSPSLDIEKNEEAAEAPATPKLKVRVAQNRSEDFRFAPALPPAAASGASSPTVSAAPQTAFSVEAESIASELDGSLRQRNVIPVQSRAALADESRDLREQTESEGLAYSRLNRAEVKSSDLTESDSGAVSRLINGRLHILLWERSPQLPEFTFWTELDLEMIEEDLGLLLSELPFASREEVSIALLDSDGEVVTQTAEGFETDWSRPFVAAEVGQILPRWEVAAYFIDPGSLDASAKTLAWTLSLIVVSLLIAVAVGSFLILKAVRYEMQLATRKTDFVSSVSHELKTPLTSIRMFSELLASGDAPDLEKTRNYSGIIHKESQRLSRLINRLLDFSRLDRNEMPLRSESISLGSLVEETVEAFALQLENGEAEIETKIEEGADLEVEGDRDALEQVFLNLLSNAEKYGGREICVVLTAGERGSAVVEVMDRGPGVPRALREKIFEKFFRVDDSIASGIEGTGIGLALSRQLVEKHGGTIRCEAREGGGSSFVV
ncbi:MAG: HAMP domain-containing sensor histidine kinase, partial [Verrucomicrobiota bacterium]